MLAGKKDTGVLSNFIETNGLFKPMTSYFRHAHDFWEIVFYTSGEGVLEMEGVEKNIPFQPGTVVCIPPDTYHREHSSDGYMNRWVGIRQLDTLEQVPVFQVSLRHPVFLLMDILFVESREDRNDTALIIRNLFQTFLLYLNEWLTTDEKGRLVNNLKHEITAHATEADYQIRAAMKGQSFSLDHARRVFRQQTGMTPKQYLTRERMARAREMLLLGLSVKATALSTGYTDPYHFSKAFQKHHDTSPTEWRKQQKARDSR